MIVKKFLKHYGATCFLVFFCFFYLCDVEPPENHGSRRVLESLEKHFQSCSHRCSKSLPAPVNSGGDLHDSPLP